MEIEKNDVQEEINFPAEKERVKKSTFRPVALLILAVFLASIFGAIFGFLAGRLPDDISVKNLKGLWSDISGTDKKVENQEKNIKQIVQEDSTIMEVVEKSSPAVVSITISRNVANQNSLFYDPFGLYEFFGRGNGSSGNNSPQEEPQKKTIGSGSGFLITKDGMIVTNKHVVSEKDAEYTVITSDEKEHLAKVLALDPVNDIAIMKIEVQDYPTLDLGDSDALKIGQTVLAIGNSLGEFSNTVSKGIVSGLRRSLTASGGRGESEKLSNIIQTDAAINPGNSGGPLLDINGEVIGINVAMAQGAQSVGFAIPANQIKKIVDQVQKTGKVIYPYLGVRYIPIDQDIKKKFNFSYDYGALVVRGDTVTDFAVIPGSPADKAGIVENDVILEIDGAKIDSKNGLADIIAKNSVGDVVTLKVWHKGELREARVELTERPQ